MHEGFLYGIQGEYWTFNYCAVLVLHTCAVLPFCLSLCYPPHLPTLPCFKESQGTACRQLDHHGNRRFEAKLGLGLNYRTFSSTLLHSPDSFFPLHSLKRELKRVEWRGQSQTDLWYKADGATSGWVCNTWLLTHTIRLFLCLSPSWRRSARVSLSFLLTHPLSWSSDVERLHQASDPSGRPETESQTARVPAFNHEELNSSCQTDGNVSLYCTFATMHKHFLLSVCAVSTYAV